MAQVKKIRFALTSAMLLSATLAQAQVVDRVPDVTITGKRAVGIFAPNSATCEDIVARDPLVAQQILASKGDPLFGPTIYQPTRTPRSPDYAAAPAAPPGAPLPDIASKWVSGHAETTAIGRDATMDPVPTFTDQGVSAFAPNAAAVGPVGFAANEFIASETLDSTTLARQVCQGIHSTQAGAQDPFFMGRQFIALRDKTLPLGFALFDQGRYPEALDWFLKAYKKLPDEYGGDEASLMIGKIYLQGLGDKSDTGKAIFWLTRAAGAKFDVRKDMPIFDPLQPDRNTAIGEAAVILANIHLTGFGGAPKDVDAARKWLARAEYVGHVPAGKVLGDLYFNGKYMPRDEKKAFNYYKKAATLNHPAAQVALANMYYSGAEGVPANLDAALGWYNQAAKYEQPEALYALAVAYDTGEGVAGDPQKALVFYKAAAMGGNADAQAAIGSYFYEGKLVPRDLALARKWFQEAAIRSQPDAMYNLAVMMMKGEGGEKDQTRAWVWFKLAQTVGSQRAATALAALERRMSPAEKQNASQLYTPRRQG